MFLHVLRSKLKSALDTFFLKSEHIEHNAWKYWSLNYKIFAIQCVTVLASLGFYSCMTQQGVCLVLWLQGIIVERMKHVNVYK